MDFIQMSFKDWANEFKPIKNPLVNTHDEYVYETYGDERELVMAARKDDPYRVWTWVDTAEGEVILDGCHACNRLGYYITEKASQKGVTYNIE